MFVRTPIILAFITFLFQRVTSDNEVSFTNSAAPSIISDTPSIVPSLVPTIYYRCVDVEGWRDEHGDGCALYAHMDHCEDFGDSYAVDGITANMACCVCGGGFQPSASPSTSPSDFPSLTPSTSPSALPSSSPSVSPTEHPTATAMPTFGNASSKGSLPKMTVLNMALVMSVYYFSKFI